MVNNLDKKNKFQNIIAISGKANSGKNTIAEQIGYELAYQEYRIFAFADPIKKIAQIMFPDITTQTLWGDSENRKNIIQNALDGKIPLTCRKLLTDLGKFGRKYNSDIWIKATYCEIQKYLNSSKYKDNLAIVGDVRFLNEFKFLKERGVVCIRIIRPEKNKKLTLWDNIKNIFNKPDISETDLDHVSNSYFDYIIYNDGSLDDLLIKVNDICEQIRAKNLHNI